MPGFGIFTSLTDKQSKCMRTKEIQDLFAVRIGIKGRYIHWFSDLNLLYADSCSNSVLTPDFNGSLHFLIGLNMVMFSGERVGFLPDSCLVKGTEVRSIFIRHIKS